MDDPKFHDDPDHRAQARRMRDRQWVFADLVIEHGTLWFCWWDKAGRHDDREKRPSNLYVTCLITGCDILDWLGKHEDWWVIGEWDDVRYAAPVRLTEAGQDALTNREAFDMESVDWGLVEPGHRAIPEPQS